MAEAESELVSGFMTEHSAGVFVFFFLAEYASIVLICILTSILFLGGYLNFYNLESLIDFLDFYAVFDISVNFFTTLFQGLIFSLNLGLKACFLIFVFI
ncbi:hypothetical protein GCM10027600_06480 [Nocardioides ginsengisegetis]